MIECPWRQQFNGKYGRTSVGVAHGSAENIGKERTDETVLPPTAQSIEVGGKM